jgi:hypothetical protein
MPTLGTILIAVSGLIGFLYMTRMKGAIAITTPLLIFMGLIYWKQNKLLYIPGMKSGI